MLNWSAILMDPMLALSQLTRITHRMRNSWLTALFENVPPLVLLSRFSLEYRSSQPSLQIALKNKTFSTSNGSVLGACWGTEELGWNEGSRKKLRDVR